MTEQHRVAAERIQGKLSRWHGWSDSWAGLWWAHKLAMHEARAGGKRPNPVMACWSLGMQALERRADLYPWQRLRLRRALAERLGLPRDL